MSLREMVIGKQEELSPVFRPAALYMISAVLTGCKVHDDTAFAIPLRPFLKGVAVEASGGRNTTRIFFS